MMMTDFLTEVQEKDPKAAWTLRAIQGIGISIEQQLIDTAVMEMRTRKGVIAGMAASGPLVDKIKNQVMNDVDKQKLDGEQAKVILQWLQKAREEIDISLVMNQRELAIQEGIIEGLKKAVSHCEQLYKDQENKVRVRMNESERGRRDEGGRPLPIREIQAQEDSQVNAPKAEVQPNSIQKLEPSPDNRINLNVDVKVEPSTQEGPPPKNKKKK